MSREIQAAGLATGATYYARVRRISDNYVWNTSGTPAFQVYATAQVANYDIAMTEEGSASGSYVGDFPTGITTPGDYGIEVFKRIGGSPAEGDPLVGKGSIYWNGSTATNSASAVLSSGDIDGFTLEQAIKLCLSALAGKLSGAGATTVTIRAADDSKSRIIATVDAEGNRTNITLDAAG